MISLKIASQIIRPAQMFGAAALALGIVLSASVPSHTALASGDQSYNQLQLAQGGQRFCVTCYGETNDMTSKRTCYDITVPSQINMRLFGIRQCTSLSGNLWYNFERGSCEGKRYCTTVIQGPQGS